MGFLLDCLGHYQVSPAFIFYDVKLSDVLLHPR
jgi:hypothetical protein